MEMLYLFINKFLCLEDLSLTDCFSSNQTMSLNSIQLTNQLHRGMSYSEVVELLGKPKSSHSNSEQLIVRWNLQEMWRGYIPYDLVFNASDKSLISWSENSKALELQQRQLKIIIDEMGKIEQAISTTNGSEIAANVNNDPVLMKYFQGAYFYYNSSSGGTGGTEKEISLCPNGMYFYSSESSYSGGAGTSDAWGTSSQNGDSGTWKITGTKKSGIIVMTSSNGEISTVEYSTCGNGCVYFAGDKYGYNGAPKCR